MLSALHRNSVNCSHYKPLNLEVLNIIPFISINSNDIVLHLDENHGVGKSVNFTGLQSISYRLFQEMRRSEPPGNVELVQQSIVPGLKGIESLLRDDDAIGRAAVATHNTLEADHTSSVTNCSPVIYNRIRYNHNGHAIAEPSTAPSGELVSQLSN